MGFFIFVIVIIVLVMRVNKAAEQNKKNRPNQQNPQQPIRQQYNPAANNPYQMNNQQRMAETKARLEQKYGAPVRNAAPQQTAANAYAAPKAEKKPQAASDIVQKAKLNNAKLAKDETLNQIEESHKHSEKAVAKPVEHSAVCQSQGNPMVDVPTESMFGSVEDLMAKGYDGNMNFDRDFVAEATDMLTSFTLGSKFC